MRTTLALDDELIAKAQALTGMKEKSTVVREALKALIERERLEHLRVGDPNLVALLEAGQVLTHPFIIGELALGSLRNRDGVVSDLSELPSATVATHSEVLDFIRRNALFGRGIGYVDTHLLAAARLTVGTSVWTNDKRLKAVAEILGQCAVVQAHKR